MKNYTMGKYLVNKPLLLRIELFLTLVMLIDDRFLLKRTELPLLVTLSRNKNHRLFGKFRHLGVMMIGTGVAATNSYFGFSGTIGI